MHFGDVGLIANVQQIEGKQLVGHVRTWPSRLFEISSQQILRLRRGRVKYFRRVSAVAPRKRQRGRQKKNQFIDTIKPAAV
jgi:hypothetical protein